MIKFVLEMNLKLKKTKTNVKYKYDTLFMECTCEDKLLIIHELKIIYLMK